MFKMLPTLLETHTDIANEAYGWDPTKVLAESHEIIAWKCKNNHEWETKISNRTKTVARNYKIEEADDFYNKNILEKLANLHFKNDDWVGYLQDKRSEYVRSKKIKG